MQFQRTNRMLIAMVVVFGICWLPLNTINFIADLDLVPIYCWEYHHFMFFVCHVLAMSSTCYNPFLYGLFNETFQKGFVQVIPFLRIFCRPTSPEKEQSNDLPLCSVIPKNCALVEANMDLRRNCQLEKPKILKSDQESSLNLPLIIITHEKDFNNHM